MFLEVVKEFLYLKYKEIIARVPWLWIGAVWLILLSAILVVVGLSYVIKPIEDVIGPVILSLGCPFLFTYMAFEIFYPSYSFRHKLLIILGMTILWITVVLSGSLLTGSGLEYESIICLNVYMLVGVGGYIILREIFVSFVNFLIGNWSMAKRRVIDRRAGNLTREETQ